MLRIGIVAGEASGDYLAAALIRSIKLEYPDVSIEGIGGPRMQEEGCRNLFSSEKLAVMGLFEVAGRLLELLRIRSWLVDYFRASPPDIFIGVDAPDFNLGLEQSLRSLGIKTVHYVSPSVWAWRQYRINKIKRATDLMLVLFPFEEEIYRQHAIPVKFVGHPLADTISAVEDKSAVKHSLGLPDDMKVIAIMPGSRRSELEKMLPLQLDTAAWCSKQRDDLLFVTSAISPDALEYIESISQQRQADGLSPVRLKVYQNKAHELLSIADAGLLTSGTVTLEALLLRLPMVVAYRMNSFSYPLIRAMVKIKFAALPNLLAGRQVVSEFLQGDCQPDKMGRELLDLLDNDPARSRQIQAFESIHRTLQQNASVTAANAVLALSGKT
ncbi:MAG: lipid-A-disaccharide synthase, partial [Gammaproteobacteria bacterium]